MHGDDVASAGVEVTTQIVSKATEILFDILKIAIEKERERKRQKGAEKSEEMSGGEVTYQRLKEGGEVTMLPSFAKEDYKELLRQAKKMNIPVAAIQEKGKENTLSLFFNVKDKEAVNAIVKDIVQEKLKQPEQTERMITIEKEQAEGFQMYCSDHDIPVNFMETQSGVKCIFSAAYEKQMEAAVKNYKQLRDELSRTSIEVKADLKGKPQIIASDTEQGKRLTVNFCTKAKLERVLQERLGYSKVKAVEAANMLGTKLTEKQSEYYRSGSRQLEEMEYYEKDIKFADDNVLTDKFSFAKMKFKEEETPKLTIADEHGNFVVLSAKAANRAEVEKSIRRNLKIEDSETIRAVLSKTERLGFAETPVQKHYKEYLIERDTQSTFTVRGGTSVVRLNLNDRETARKQLTDSFGMTSAKADKIIDKARKQTVSDNLLKRARKKAGKSAGTLKDKKIDRGSRK